MKTKDIYKENKERKYCQIVDIKNENVEVESAPIKVIKENWKKYLAATLIILAIIIFTFYKDLKVLFSVIAFFAFIALLSIVSNIYSMKCKENSLSLKFNFQKFELPYSRIANIYLSKDFTANDLIPMINYNLVIRYIDNMNFLKELSFSTMFLKEEKLKEFLDNFVISNEEQAKCVKYEKYKLFKKILKSSAFIIFIIALIVVVCLKIK